MLHSHFFLIMFSRFRITENKCWILEDHIVVQGQCSFIFNLELISFLINSYFFSAALPDYDMSNILPDYDTSNVVGVSWKAEYAYPTGASGLSSTYLAESECWLLFSFCCVNFKFLRVEFRLCHCYLDLVLVSGFWDWLSLESRFFMTSLDSIYIFNYLSLSKDRKMSLWPWYLTIDIENKHSDNLND